MSALIVEDNVEIGASLLRLMESQGWRVEWASTVEAAKSKITAYDPDLIVLDLCMSGHDVEDLLAQAETRRVVVLSAAPSCELEELARRHPKVEVLQKPKTWEELMLVLGRGRKGIYADTTGPTRGSGARPRK